MRKDKRASTNIGANLKQLLKMRGISQKEIAQKLHISASNISDWINGKTDPSLCQTVALANLFSISIDLLVLGNRNGVSAIPANESNNEEIEEMDELSEINDNTKAALDSLLFNRKLKEEWLAFMPLLKYIDIEVVDSVKKASEITQNQKPREITCKIRPKGYAIQQNKPVFVWDVRGSYTQLFLIKVCWAVATKSDINYSIFDLLLKMGDNDDGGYWVDDTDPRDSLLMDITLDDVRERIDIDDSPLEDTLLTSIYENGKFQNINRFLKTCPLSNIDFYTKNY